MYVNYVIQANSSKILNSEVKPVQGEITVAHNNQHGGLDTNNGIHKEQAFRLA